MVDLLSEYSGIGVVPGEFDEVRRAGMIGDYVAGNISQSNPANLMNVYWNGGYWIHQYYSNKYHLRFIAKHLIIRSPFAFLYKNKKYLKTKILKRLQLLKKIAKDLEKIDTQEKKIERAHTYIKEIQNLYTHNDDKFLLFDQPIFFNTHQDVWPLIFDPFKLLVVYRDPRDQIAQLIKENLLYYDRETPTRGVVEIYGEGRIGGITYELDALLARMRNIEKLQTALGESKIKLIRFEDMIYHYDTIVGEVEEFLGLDPEKHKVPLNYFKPNESVKNIGIYKQYLSKDELQLFAKSERYFYEKQVDDTHGKEA